MVTSNGIFRPIALVDGRAVATWSLSGTAIALEPFAPLDPGTAVALHEDGDDVRRYLGLEDRPSPRSPP